MFREGAALVGMVLLAGCGTDVVVTGPGSSDPYDGPMHVAVTNADAASVLERSGAAGHALECDGRPYNGGSGDYDSGLVSTQSAAEAALEKWLDEDYFGAIPQSGFRTEREDGGRTLFSYDVEGRSKVTVIAADSITDVDGQTGWGVETWAQCDPSELPDAVTEDLGIQVWTNPNGERAPHTRIQSYAGPDHCDWQDITFLSLDEGRRPQVDPRQFLRDTEGALEEYLTTTFAEVNRLPEGAQDTGFSREGRRLWLDTAPRAAYLVDESDPSSIERWPASTEPIHCA